MFPPYDPHMELRIKTRESRGKDRLGNIVYTYGDEKRVSGCLWAPGTPQDLAVERPEGVKIVATAYLPKNYTDDVRKALMSADGKAWLTVIGDPQSYPQEMLPSYWKWNRLVLLGDIDG